MMRWLYRWLPIIFGCHCRSDRSFFFRGKQFPLCARCTGELIGILLAPAAFWIFGLPDGKLCLWLLLPLVLALVHHNRTFAVQKPAERKAVFAMLCLTSFVILQGAGLYATFQMPS